jgi:hypothetical protein
MSNFAMNDQNLPTDFWDDAESGAVLASVRHYGIDLCPGQRVRLWPKRNADIMDLALAGKVATIEALEQDLENNVHVAVVLDDDPGKELGLSRFPGHRFFFSLDEIEPMNLPDNQSQRSHDTKSQSQSNDEEPSADHNL